MREALTAEHLQAFIKGLAAVARSPSRIYLVGGASAVVLGWRDSTVDVDLKIIPETDELLRSLPRLKEQLHINIELASPWELFLSIKDQIYRYPELDARVFQEAVSRVVKQYQDENS